MKLLIGFVIFKEKRMLLQRSKNAVADLQIVSVKQVNCQGLKWHPFHGKDIAESLAEGTAKG